MNIKQSILLRVRIAFLGMGFVALLIVSKIAYIQFAQGEKWVKRAEKRDIKFRILKAQRGNILDDNNNLLATSLPFYTVAIDPTAPDEDVFNKGIDSLAFLLSTTFKANSKEDYKKELLEARKAKKRYVSLYNKNINFQQRQMMEKFPILREGKYKGGAIFDADNTRYLPFGGILARTVGYIDEETNKGKVGLEYSFDKFLAGKNGQALTRRLDSKHWEPVHNSQYIMPENGMDVYTTLNINFQDVAHTALQEALVENDADYGCVVVMEVKTGEIKAMANLGKTSEGTYTENYNYAIGDKGSTDPGSVFKLASMMALLEDNKVKLTDQVETGDGAFKFYGTVLKDSKKGGHGTISVQRMFEVSSSIGIAKLVNQHYKDNPQSFINLLEKFGLKDKLHFKLVGEAEPYIKNTNDPTWSITSLPWMSIGYEMRISPLQMLVFYNSVANKGKMMQPMIVRRVQEDDDPIEEFEPVLMREKICSDSTLMLLNTLLQGVVERGTARTISSKEYKIAGKTSTSQKFRTGRYIQSYHTSFAGYFPAENPKYSCIVVIDNPRGKNQSGGDAAAPAFRKIADKIFALDLEMHPQSKVFQMTAATQKFPQNPNGHAQDLATIFNGLSFLPNIDANYDAIGMSKASLNTDNSISWTQIDIKKNIVPNVIGMSLRDALPILENVGLKVGFSGNGKVRKQSLRPNTGFQRGRKINLELKTH